jgi:DSF synthase
MDRMGTGLDRFGFSDESESLSQDLNAHLAASAGRLAVPDGLLDLEQLEVFYDQPAQALWTFMRPTGRPSFTPELLTEFETWQALIASAFGPDKTNLRFVILGSRTPGVFCYGGDLDLFHALIRSGDRDGLVRYGYRCVEILHRNIHALGLPIVTVGVVQGAALGGGFEALLSFDHLIAERGATFGLPEVLFGLFPGMGAHALLSRKLGSAMADRIILSNKTYSAEEMYDLGVVHELAEAGEGVDAARAFVARNGMRIAGLHGAKRAMRESAAPSLGELKRIVEHWAESALQLRQTDLKLMDKLVGAQRRRSARAA